MKQQRLWFVCDENGCDEESPTTAGTWGDARRLASRHGWSLQTLDCKHYCPTHDQRIYVSGSTSKKRFPS